MNPAPQQPSGSAQLGGGQPPAPGSALEFLWKVHGYTNEYIRFADPKAAFAVAVAAGLLAALFNAKCHAFCSPSKLSLADATWDATRLGAVSTMALSCLLGSTFLLSWAITPRLWKEFLKNLAWSITHLWGGHKQSGVNPQVPAPGYIFWDDVLAHQNPTAYCQAVQALTPAQQAEAVAAHIYVLAGVASTKFRWIKWGFRTGFAGAVFAVIALALS